MLRGKAPADIRARVSYGQYDGEIQYYILDVDGSLAQLGDNLPSWDELRLVIKQADIDQAKLLQRSK